MSHSPTANSQLRLLLLMILAATACGKSPPKQAGDADSAALVNALERGDSAAFVKALEGGDSGEAANPTVPRDLVPVAVATAQDDCKRQGLECTGYAVHSFVHDELTPADRANGIEDKWCVNVSYAARSRAGPWEDKMGGGLFTKQSGAWKKAQRFCI